MTPSTDAATKKLRCIQRSADRHWVGNGFPVRTLFAYPNLGSVLTPFLLLDYAGPMEFSPSTERRGVGEHPHRGFETVTIVYSGEVAHRDSSGGGGTIGPGDVQWMTAAGGIVHEEFHSPEFARRGSTDRSRPGPSRSRCSSRRASRSASKRSKTRCCWC